MISAPAKINLDLRIVGRRADGYHLLDSLVAFPDFGDEIGLAPAPQLRFVVSGPYAAMAGADDANLALRAARLLAEFAGRPPNVSISLVKNIPVAAGLGGGSADAAAVLRGLASMWSLAMSGEELAALGLRLGADAPACLHGRPLVMRGIGEAIEDFPSPRLSLGVLLVNPGVACPTPDVFRAFARGAIGAAPVARPALAPGDRDGLLAMIAANGNDLADAAVAVAPAVADVLAALRAAPRRLHAAVTGSGATCFALFADRAGAESAAAALARAHPAWWIRAASLPL